MRILHTAATYPPAADGVAQVVKHLSEGMVRLGHEVHVATAEVPGRRAGAAVIDGVHVETFRARGNRAAGMSGELDRYRGFVRSGRWDVAVHHCAQIWTTDSLLPTVASNPFPSILVTHGLSAYSNLAYRAYFAELAALLPAFASWVTISDCSAEWDFAADYRLSPPASIANGVDPAEWSRPPLGVRARWSIGERPWILNVSNHNPAKNHPAFFDLARHLASADVRFTLVGGASPVARWNLGRWGLKGGCYYACRLRELRQPEVSLREGVPRTEVVSTFQEADLLVSTSQLEANSIVLLEAMAAGLPWVALDVGSARQNVGGFVVENLAQMADRCRLLLRDRALRDELGAHGRQRVQERHAWPKIVDQYLKLCRAAVAQTGAARPPREHPDRPPRLYCGR
jgi:glycosyltransferase involved in cell wall biosynthesis